MILLARQFAERVCVKVLQSCLVLLAAHALEAGTDRAALWYFVVLEGAADEHASGKGDCPRLPATTVRMTPTAVAAISQLYWRINECSRVFRQPVHNRHFPVRCRQRHRTSISRL